MEVGEKRAVTILILLLCIFMFTQGVQISKASSEPGATLTGVIYGKGLDDNGDGTYDRLEVGVQVNITKGGPYKVDLSGAQ